MSKLFSPIQLRGSTIKNRIFVSPMCQYSAHDGILNDWHRVHYGSRAVGGAGLVMIEASSVSPAGRITPYDSGIWSAQQVEALRPIIASIREQGATPGIQLAHAGRKGSCTQPWMGGKGIAIQNGGWQPLAPSAVPFSTDYNLPREMDQADIDKVTAEFATATKLALVAGFETVEIHMAHGYLLHQFLSPLSNRRSDSYGGSLANRMRFPMQVAQTVRELWPEDKPVMVRISATDWVEGGWDMTGSLTLVNQLKAIGIDMVDVSSGGLVPGAVIPAAPGYQTAFAAELRKQTGMAISAVGMITGAIQAEHILVTGQADVVSIARELLRDPYWPLHAAKSLGVDLPWPPQYRRAKP